MMRSTTEPGVLLLINPCIRQVVEIPRLGNRRPFTQSSLPYMFGFGYARAVDDYKLVKISCKGFVFVYSMRAKSWRSVGSFAHKIVAFDPGVQLNGAVHWVASCGGDLMSFETIGFDLVGEKFYVVRRPDGVEGFYGIGVFGGCLCVMPDETISSYNEFWVMKRYGEKDSWMKISINVSYFRMKPLGIFENYRELLDIDGKLVVYNRKDGTCNDIVIDGIPVGTEFEVKTCVESLVSPHLSESMARID